MKKQVLIFFALIIISFHVVGKAGYTLNVNVKGSHGGGLELRKFYQELLDEKNSSTEKLENSKCKFEGTIGNPIRVFLIFTGTDGTRLYSPVFYIDLGKQEVILDSATFEHGVPVFKGSRTNDLNLHYLEAFRASEVKLRWLTDSLDRLSINLSSNNDPGLKKKLGELKQSINDKRDDFTDSLVNVYKNEYLSVWIIDSCLRERFSPKLERTFNRLSPEIKQSRLGLAVKKSFLDVQAVLPGGHLPELSLIDTTGRKYKETFKREGKYLFVELWFSHCAPCLARLPALKDIYKRRDEFNLEFVGISVRETSTQDWKGAIDRYKIPWSQRFDYSRLFLDTYKIHFFPSNLIVDPTGKIVARDLEPAEVMRFLEHSKYP
ncbi:TlpA disulfide reductase family protein [Mucilaginibacter sp. SJ]|uniref:TlpA disulfide reductase family protein n=1 Tax=Mucilaginibacter sp. SJ TaxID=3029053 RepID=UPI0023AA0BD8|nr:TlpA disulfide reductase family protein [Mucilaginibacter sp. SJ]WEA01824.1 TlpA disulfide reductase family protein [Mucilaginibacter sp. SJ]